MPASKRRKQVLLPKHKKIRVTRRIFVAQRKIKARKFVKEEILVVPGGKKRVGIKQQLYNRTQERRRNREKYSKKIKTSKKYKKLYAYVKKYKAVVRKKYIREMVAEMRKSGRYFPQEIYFAQYYSIVGMQVQFEIAKLKSFKKFRSKKLEQRSIKRAVKKARIQSYMDILGITKKKAMEVYQIITKHLPGEFELKALIY